MIHQKNFYPRSPCGERRADLSSYFGRIIFLSTLSLRRATLYINRTAETIIFLSTLSLRRATGSNESGEDANNDFYPRSPCGERPWRKYPVILGRVISIHALLAESDCLSFDAQNRHLPFLSTLSLRRATKTIPAKVGRSNHFYPRSPCGERRQ